MDVNRPQPKFSKQLTVWQVASKIHLPVHYLLVAYLSVIALPNSTKSQVTYSLAYCRTYKLVKAGNEK